MVFALDGSGEFARIQNRFITSMGQYVESYGGSEIMGRIIGLLLFAPEPVSLTEIAKSLQISKAAASINMKYLRQMKAVEKVTLPGDRGDYYRMDEDYGYGVFSSSFRKKIQDGLELIGDALLDLDGLGERKSIATAAIARERLQEMRELYQGLGKLYDELRNDWDEKKLKK